MNGKLGACSGLFPMERSERMENPNIPPDWIHTLEMYEPQDEREAEEKDMMLELVRSRGSRLLFRENRDAHFTASSIIVNRERTRTLMIYHRIYESWAWTGGHADGSGDFEQTARREAMEETGIAHLRRLGDGPASLEILPVWYHIRRGKPVGSHLHLNISYLFEADEREPIRIAPDENSGVEWIDIQQLGQKVSEEPMMPIYGRLIGKANIL